MREILIIVKRNHMFAFILAQTFNHIPHIDAPMFGSVPVEILDTCVQETGNIHVDDLITDSDFEIYEACMIQYLGEA